MVAGAAGAAPGIRRGAFAVPFCKSSIQFLGIHACYEEEYPLKLPKLGQVMDRFLKEKDCNICTDCITYFSTLYYPHIVEWRTQWFQQK